MRVLFENLIDFAGLFPPAGLDLNRAAQAYESYRQGPWAFMLGRFIVPAARLEELLPHLQASTWPLSVIVEGPADLERLQQFESQAGERARVESVEGRLPLEIPSSLKAYWEVDPSRTPLQGGYKLRAGGLVAEAFPEPSQVVAFLQACLQAGRPMKATAGLHHARPGEYPLTYAPDSPCARMLGFVPLLAAAVGLFEGTLEPARACQLLESAEVTVSPERVSWGAWQAGTEAVAACRRHLFHSFGSCSFEEPVAELEELGWAA